jgi:hypothetical protein
MRERVSGGPHVTQQPDLRQKLASRKNRLLQHLFALKEEIPELFVAGHPRVLYQANNQSQKKKKRGTNLRERPILSYPVSLRCINDSSEACTTQGENLNLMLMLPRVRSSRLPIIDIPSPG